MTVSEDFTGLTDRFRGELLAHCYRMLGSAEEAEDLVQETYLRAWRSYDGFEGRASVRTWLYRIATNVCLTAIERSRRRPLPSGLGGPAEDPEAPVVAGLEVPWLQPLPGALLAGKHEDPAAVAVSRAGIRLAFVAALQYLSARQRAVLILRDVLEWPAAEVADLLGTTTTAVNSGLRRARAQLAQALPDEEEIAEPAEPDRRALLDRFAAAIENADASALAEMLRQDVALEMPPQLTWFTGRQAVTRFVASNLLTEPGRLRLVSVMANGQPAFAVYQREPGAGYRAHAVLVLTVTSDGDRADRQLPEPRPVRVVRSATGVWCRRADAGAGHSGLPVDPLSRGRELLETAVSYALAGAALGTPQLLQRPTPCQGWDLETLLDHVSDSIGVLREAMNAGDISASAASPDYPRPGPDPIARLRGQAARLLGACSVAGPAERRVAVGDRELTAGMIAVTGAIEITVHGWDISVACGARRPVPPGLAAVLLPIAPLLITPETRPGLFADPVRLPGPASPGDQLVAFLGRQPRPLAAPGSGGA